MALSDLYQTLIAQAIKVARANSIMPRLINSDVAGELASRGEKVNVPIIPETMTPSDIVPGPTPPASASPDPDSVPVSLDYWKFNQFRLTDKEITTIANRADYIPKQLEAAAAGIADAVDASIFNLYTGVYGLAGTPGTTPFSTSLAAAQQARQLFSRQYVPAYGNRSIVINEDAMSNACGVEALQRVDPNVVKEGMIGRAMGFNFHEDQNAPFHTTTGGAGFLVNGAQAAGVATLAVDGGAIAPQPGDIFTIAGDDQQYVVGAGATLTNWPIAPALREDAADNAVITFAASHVVNLAFHEQAFAYASRAVNQVVPDYVPATSWVDELSGLVLTLEVDRQHYQTAFKLSCMWGCKLVQPRYAVRIAG